MYNYVEKSFIEIQYVRMDGCMYVSNVICNYMYVDNLKLNEIKKFKLINLMFILIVQIIKIIKITTKKQQK